MPLGDFNLLPACLELHMFCSGSSNCIGYKEAHFLYTNIKRRLDEWHFWSTSPWVNFDEAVRNLCIVACKEYKKWRTDFINRNQLNPEDLTCWQDGNFDDESKARWTCDYFFIKDKDF